MAAHFELAFAVRHVHHLVDVQIFAAARIGALGAPRSFGRDAVGPSALFDIGDQWSDVEKRPVADPAPEPAAAPPTLPAHQVDIEDVPLTTRSRCATSIPATHLKTGTA